jgi:diaminopimelate decarboxylase
MFRPKNGILHIGGISVCKLAEKYPGPFYVYDGDAIELQMARIKSLLAEGVEVIYSIKANPNASIVALLSTVADGVDISSLREMQVALLAGFTPAQIFFVGPCKSQEEIEAAIRTGIGCLVVESKEELLAAERIAGRLARPVNVALRLNPAFDATGPRLKMGGAATQFGIDEEQAGDVIAACKSLSNVHITGLHAYVGTRILDWPVAVRNTKEILDLALRIQDAHGLELKLVDVGGGLGVPYFPGEESFDFERFAAEVNPVFCRFQALMPGVRLVMELGRFVVAEAGVYVSQVRYIKTSRGKKYVLVSGGMNHHQATTAISSIVKSHFPIKVLNKIDAPALSPVAVCGPLCTPNDVLGRLVELPDVEVGDLIGIMNSGAYGMTASPLEFLSHSWPNEVLIYDGVDHLVRRSPTLEESLQLQPLVRVKSQVPNMDMVV